MSTPYIGEIRLFGFPRTPVGWFTCDGSLKSIAEYETLYALIGTTYGGDGQTTFGVPDLRGRIPVHIGTMPGGSTYAIGQKAGTETVTLLTTQMPAHAHAVVASATLASVSTPGPTLVTAGLTGDTMYATEALTPNAPLTMSATTVTEIGGNQPHENMMPTQVAQYCIAWQGIFPSQG